MALASEARRDAAERRISALLAQLTLEEKASMTAGAGAWWTTPVERLGIPSLKLTDGPSGARGEARGGVTSAAFPVGVALAATWDPELIEAVGAALGEEALSKGAQVLLGPTVNIQRTPIGGRNFECYSEDPHLSGRIATAFVRGVQSRGVAACLKHFACNDTEFQRMSVSSEVGERALREIYLRPFEMAVGEADAWCVMSAYNRVNGRFAGSHHRLLTEILRGEWGFRGLVMSDWGAATDGTAAAANAGLDLEMPGPGRYLGAHLLAAGRAGDVPERALDDAARRLLRLLVRTGRLDDAQGRDEISDDRPEHRALARRAAAAGMVLLKNEHAILPLDRARLRTLAVIGPNAATGVIMGGGSSQVAPHYVVHPLDALRARCGDAVTVVYEQGCRNAKFAPEIDPARYGATPDNERPVLVEYFDSPDCTGRPVYARDVRRIGAVLRAMLPGVADQQRFSCRWTATFTPQEDGAHTFGLAAIGRAHLLVDGVQVIDNWSAPAPGEWLFGYASAERTAALELQAGRAYRVVVEYGRNAAPGPAGVRFGMEPPGGADDLIDRAVSAAGAADAAVLVAGTTGEWETEGYDRRDIRLPRRQDELIERVARANPHTVVVINAGSPVCMDWLADVPAVLVSWFPGQEFGNALADVLFGEVSPSGRLPLTFPKRIEDTPAFPHYPGADGRMPYGEDIFVGYRGYDARGVEPLFPFGHGLSYTSFEYGEPRVSVTDGGAVAVEVDVTNTGARAGAEVVQCYVRDLESSLPRPPQELKGFRKLALTPGETATARIALDRRAFAFYDPDRAHWVLEPGEFELLIGASSRDIRRTARLTLPAG
jgi:beta-glucosidase